jgi:lipoprotein-releasing system permease protein
MTSRSNKTFQRFITHRWLQESGWLFPKGSAKFAVLAIALGVFISFMSIAAGQGLQQAIHQKIRHFEGDLLLTPYPTEIITESLSSPDLDASKFSRVIEKVNAIAVLRSSKKVKGVQVKGISSNDLDFLLTDYLVRGALPASSNSSQLTAILSETIANESGLEIGNDFFLLFNSGSGAPKQRKFKLSATFQTDFPVYDESLVFTSQSDLKGIIKDELVSEYSAYASDGQDPEILLGSLNPRLLDFYETSFLADQYPDLYQWIELFDLNIIIILVVVLGVAFFALVTTLISQIIERRTSLGLLISMGASQSQLRTLFSQLGSYFVLVGAFYGTFASWILILVQNHFKILKFRNPEEYYITYIPFELSVVDTLIYLILFLSIGWVVIQLSSKALRRLNPIHLLRI